MKKCCIFCPEWNIFQKIQWFRTPQFISYKQCNFRENRTTFIFWSLEGAAHIKFTMVACRISSVLNLRQITLLLFILAGWWNTLSLEKISAGKDDKQSHRCSRKTFRIYRAHPVFNTSLLPVPSLPPEAYFKNFNRAVLRSVLLIRIRSDPNLLVGSWSHQMIRIRP